MNKRWMTPWILLCFAAALSAAVETGKPAPDFTLPAVGGGKVSLKEHTGKFVVLEWINHDCPFVLKHYNSGNMQALQRDYTEKGVVWLSINSSAKGKQGNFSVSEWKSLTEEKKASPTAVLLDGNGKVGKTYGAKTTPHMYIVNPEGVLIYQGAIDDKPSADPKDIPTSKNYVRAALDEAMEGRPVSEPATKPYGCSVKYR